MAVHHKTQEAEQDVVEILQFLDGRSQQAAERFAREYDRVCDLIAAQLRMGRSRGDLRPGLRSVTVQKYVVFYQLVPDGVAIVRVVHGSRDLTTLFEDA